MLSEFAKKNHLYAPIAQQMGYFDLENEKNWGVKN